MLNETLHWEKQGMSDGTATFTCDNCGFQWRTEYDRDACCRGSFTVPASESAAFWKEVRLAPFVLGFDVAKQMAMDVLLKLSTDANSHAMKPDQPASWCEAFTRDAECYDDARAQIREMKFPDDFDDLAVGKA